MGHGKGMPAPPEALAHLVAEPEASNTAVLSRTMRLWNTVLPGPLGFSSLHLNLRMNWVSCK